MLLQRGQCSCSAHRRHPACQSVASNVTAFLVQACMNPRLQPVRWTGLPTAWKLDVGFVIQGAGCQGSGHQPDATTEKSLLHSLLWKTILHMRMYSCPSFLFELAMFLAVIRIVTREGSS
jgi:hypothetical protein